MNTQKGVLINIWFFAILILVLIHIPIGSANTNANENEISDHHVQTMISDYKNRIISNQLELLELKENLEWLNLKVKAIRSSSRPVSGEITQSLQYKTNKIMALEKERAYCLERMLHYKEQLRLSENSKESAKNNQLIKRLKAKIEKANLSDWVEIVQEKNTGAYRLKTTLPILFSSGSAVIVKEYQDFLKKLAVLVKDLDSLVIVDGFADIDPIHTNKYPSNFELGATRAANVVHMLIKNGVKPSMFKIASTGRYRFPPIKISKNKTLERYVNITLLVEG